MGDTHAAGTASPPALGNGRDRSILTPVLAVLLVFVLGVGGWGIWRWANYPTPPDAATSDAATMADFITTDDFHRLSRGDQRQYALAYVEKLGELSLAELLQRAVMPDEQRREVLRQLEEAGVKQETLTAAHGMVLDKYWSLTPEQRESFLTLLVLADPENRVQGGQRRGEDTIRQQMSGVMQYQPPEVQGQMSRFLLDLERRRKEMRQGPLFGGL